MLAFVLYLFELVGLLILFGLAGGLLMTTIMLVAVVFERRTQ